MKRPLRFGTRAVADMPLRALTTFADRPRTLVGGLGLLPPAHRDVLLTGRDNSEVPQALTGSTPALFAEQAARTPDAAALAARTPDAAARAHGTTCSRTPNSAPTPTGWPGCRPGQPVRSLEPLPEETEQDLPALWGGY